MELLEEICPWVWGSGGSKCIGISATAVKVQIPTRYLLVLRYVNAASHTLETLKNTLEDLPVKFLHEVSMRCLDMCFIVYSY